MKKNPQMRWIVLLVIIILAMVFYLLFSCEKEKVSDYACYGTVIRSAPGYISDTISYQMTKLGVSNEDILWFQDNRNYTMIQLQSGVLVTTVSTLICKNVTCVEIK
jgi:lipoprotein signal peptidase